jgi:Tol biopolymer transport system component
MGVRSVVVVGSAVAALTLSAAAPAAIPGEVIVANDATVGSYVLVLPGGGIARTVACGGDLSNGPSARSFARPEPVGVENPYQIVAYDEDCGAPTTLFSDASLGIRLVRWSRDGTRLGFYAQRFQSGAVVEQGIYVGEVLRVGPLPATLTNVRLAVPLSTPFAFFSWASDNRRVTFDLEQAGQADIMIASVDTGVVVNVTNTPGESERRPDFSPADDRIAFTKVTWMHSIVRTDVFIMSSSGGAQTQLTTKSNTHTSINIHPSWSPDGASITFSGMPNGQPLRHIYRVRSDASGKAVDLTPESDHSFAAPQWRR